MCGIAGFCSFNEDVNEKENYWQDMKQSLERRGPDSDGIYFAKRCCLIHARLAVVDIENGVQPMYLGNEGNVKVIVYNGELYNTEDIRKELLEKGHKFKSYSDTEVLLHSYWEWGNDCVSKLNGIYAFAIWDAKENKLFIARDRMGVKPFFYYFKNNIFIFASEIKALLKHPYVEAKADKTSLAELLLIGPGRTPGYGIFKDIEELKPGHCGIFSMKGLDIEPYWSLKCRTHNETFEETLENVGFLVKDAIKRQTISDVALCSFLSGGLDSSIITALSGVKKTFSVDYSGNDKYFVSNKFQPEQDSKYIDIMSEYLGTEHTVVTIDTNQLVDSLYKSVEARDLPGMADVDGSLLLFCKEVKKHCTVALSGECADEVFGGYPWYRDKDIRKTDGFPWSQSTGYRASFVKEGILEENPFDYVYKKYKKTVDDTSKLEQESPIESRMKEMFSLNINWFMQTLLDRKDRMSMYSGLEVRVPFCDHRIVEYLYNVPWERCKIRL